MIKENFFGRQAYLDILEKRIGALKDGYRQNIAIVGDESVGKTSIISKFLDTYYDNRLLIVYLETRPETFISFARRFIGVLLYNFLINSNHALKEDLDYLIQKSSAYIPKTIEKIRVILNDLNKRKKENIFYQLLSLCDSLTEESGKFCVVIFDEFHNLQDLGLKNIYAEWARLLIVQKKTLYVIVSSRKSKTKDILSKDLNLLFGNFEVVNVEPFDAKTTEGYLSNFLGGLNLSKGLFNFIVHFTGGYPLYLEVISESFLNSKASDATPVDILENLLFSSLGVLNQKFSNYLKRFQDDRYSQDYISILYLISNGHNKIKDIAHLAHKTIIETKSRVERLLELDTISRFGDFLKINDRVFSFWLKFVYQAKIHSLTLNAKNQKFVFRRNIESMIQEFLIETNKTVSERIMELLRLFEDDTVQFEKKRLKLSHFREIKPLAFNRRTLKDGLICRSSDSLWVMAFKYDALTEEDIGEFVKECKKYHHKTQRKIIVALSDLDANSKLRALEEKVLTWDLNNLNQILDLYSRPRIIV